MFVEGKVRSDLLLTLEACSFDRQCMLMFHETKQVFVVIYIGVAYVVSCSALPHVKMLPYNLTRQTSFLLPVLLFVTVNIRLCKLMESEEVGKTVVPIFRPDICHFFSTNVLLGTIFLHMKARKLWQKFRDKTA